LLIHNSQGIGGSQAPGAYPNLEITFCDLKKMVIDVAIFIVVLMLLVLLILLPSSGDSSSLRRAGYFFMHSISSSSLD